MGTAAQNGFGSRRADVDNLRVIALALLIVYHVLLVYSGHETWRVNSLHQGWWADYFITTLTPWRMVLVFFIGGVAVRFMLSRPSFGAFARERAARLLVAFVFAVVVLIPPQRYVRLDVLGGDAGQSYLHYLFTEAPFANPFLGTHIPQFAHAWFLPYLFAYSVLVAAIWWFAPKVFRRVDALLQASPVTVLIAVTAVWFVFLEFAVMQDHPPNRRFFNDFSAHAKYLPVFMLGVAVGKSELFRAGLDRIKWPLWAVTLALLIVNTGVTWAYLREETSELIWFVTQAVFGVAMMFSIVAFGQWALNRPSKAVTYASDAILPVYLLHQTILILVADAIVRQRWPLPLEFTALAAAATVIPITIYHVLIRRTPWLRFLFGLRPKARSHGTPPPTKAEETPKKAEETSLPQRGALRHPN